MRIPRYILEPKAGVKDSILKWEWIRKQIIARNKIGAHLLINKKCGLCIQYDPKHKTCRNCPLDKWGCVDKKITKTQSIDDVIWEFEYWNDYKDITNDVHKRKQERYRKLAIKACDLMLKELRKIK